jgi:hypothetical protein
VPDDGVVVSVPTEMTDLVVSVAGVVADAVTIDGAMWSPTPGAEVVTIALSNGTRLVLGPRR